MTLSDFSSIFWLFGAMGVLAGVMCIPHHRAVKNHKERIRKFNHFMETYLTTLHTYSKPTVARQKDTTTLSRSQKRLQEGLALYDDQLFELYTLTFGPTTYATLYLRVANIIFDRNGSVELWMNLSETTEEILYYPSEHVEHLNVAVDNLNQAICLQIQLMNKE